MPSQVHTFRTVAQSRSGAQTRRMADDLEGQLHYASTLLDDALGQWETVPDAVQARNIIASLMLFDVSPQDIHIIASDPTGQTLKHWTDRLSTGHMPASLSATIDEDQLRAIQQLNEAYLRPPEDHEPIFRIVNLAIASLSR